MLGCSQGLTVDLVMGLWEAIFGGYWNCHDLAGGWSYWDGYVWTGMGGSAGNWMIFPVDYDFKIGKSYWAVRVLIFPPIINLPFHPETWPFYRFWVGNWYFFCLFCFYR